MDEEKIMKEEQCCSCYEWVAYDQIEICIPHTDCYYCKKCWAAPDEPQTHPKDKTDEKKTDS